MANGHTAPTGPPPAPKRIGTGLYLVDAIDPRRISVIHTPHGARVQHVANVLGPGSVVVNGTFFFGTNTLGIVVSGGEVREPMDPNVTKGDRVIDFGARFVFAIFQSGQASLLPGRDFKPAGCREALGGLISVVRHGLPVEDFFGPGGWDPAAVGGARPRTAVGIKEDGKVLILATSATMTLSALAAKVIQLGAREAVALDGGRSTSLAVGGRSRPIIKGGNLPNGNDGVITTFLGVR